MKFSNRLTIKLESVRFFMLFLCVMIGLLLANTGFADEINRHLKEASSPKAAEIQSKKQGAPLQTQQEKAVYVTQIKQLFPYWGRYLKIDKNKRDKFRYVFYVKRPDGGRLNEWKLWYVWDKKKIFLNILENGELTNMPSLEVYHQNPKIYTNNTQTDRGLELRAYFEPVLEIKQKEADSVELSVLALWESYQQFSKVYQYVLGLRGLVTPKMNWLVFSFTERAPTAVAIDYKKNKIELKAEGKNVYFALKNKKLKQALILKFGRKPDRIWFES